MRHRAGCALPETISPNGKDGLAAEVLNIGNGGCRDLQGTLTISTEKIYRAVVDLQLPLPASAGAGDAIPLSDVLQFTQNLLHDQVVQEGSLGTGRSLILVHRLFQTSQSRKDRLLLTHIAAVHAGVGTGEGQGLLVQKSLGGTGHRMLLLAEETGHSQADLISHKGHINGGLSAGTGQTAAGCRQLEDRPLQDHRLAAGRTNKSNGTLGILNHKEIPPWFHSVIDSIP